MKAPEIQAYRFGQMIVDGEEYMRDLILLPDRVIANWWRKNGHRLDIEDLRVAIDAAPDVLVIGTGAYGLMKVPNETRRAVEAEGIELQVTSTGEAWRLYNELQERQTTAGAFHLTC